MTLSKGSAQYALSFYAKRDAYPFGRFRLATVFPGPKVRSPRPDACGGPSRDWVSYWPPRLIRDRTVSYLVYYTDEGDDPPEAPIVESEQQTTFRNFIEAYGGQLVHTVRRDHEGRAWIYRVTELLRSEDLVRRPRRPRDRQGRGFPVQLACAVYYHRVRQGIFKADSKGSFSGSFAFPRRCSRSTTWWRPTTPAMSPREPASSPPARRRSRLPRPTSLRPGRPPVAIGPTAIRGASP